MSYLVHLNNIQRIVLVGAGGTGSLVLEGLCKLLIDIDIPVFVIDPDRVEKHNLRRQNFYAEDLGKFKSQVLVERYSRRYGRTLSYSIWPFDKDIGFSDSGSYLHQSIMQNAIIIGCVDNHLARREIAKAIGGFNLWWLDSGNGFHSGQVLFGNCIKSEQLQQCFHDEPMVTSKLPAPSLQLPSLLYPSGEPVKQEEDCAEAVERNDQSPVINQAMAMLILEFMNRILTGTLKWMGAYIDMENGTLQTVPADPVTVARILSMKVDDLMDEDSKKKGGHYARNRNRNAYTR